MASTLKVNTIAHSGGTNAMTIDSSGNATFAQRVLHPQLPIASVTLTTANTQDATNPYTTTGADILFDKVTINRGSVYNTSNGRFTAPITGLYKFTYNLLKDDDTAANVTYVYVWKNGAEYQEAGGSGYTQSTGQYGMISMSTLVSLNATEYVTLRLTGGGLYLNADGRYHGVIFELVG